VVLNAQRRPIDDLRNGPLLFRQLEDCFFAAAGVTLDQARLRGALEDAHRARGFRPRPIPGLHNGLVDPAEMTVRAFHLWQQTHWPGRNGRVRYAHTLFNLYVIRCLALASLRVWDGGPSGAGSRLAEVQRLLGRLWTTSPPDQPVLVRDARWLIQLAQSPATDDLGAYFDVAQQIADTLPEADRLEIHEAGVRMAGGHLRSQIRYYSTKQSRPFDDESLVVATRTSNALDFALLVQELVPLLDAYERARDGGDRARRLGLADAICQGLSPDPELFLNRVDLLRAYSMIEHLFIASDDAGQPVYTPMGRRHVGLLGEYAERIGRVAKALLEDCEHFRPVAGTYSPYGVLYGFSTDLVEHIAFKTLQAGAVTRFGLEDVFAGGGADKLAWVSGWRKLPHLPRDVEKQFDYPQQFAEEIFERIVTALRAGVAGGAAPARVPLGRLFVLTPGEEPDDSRAVALPHLAVQYIASSDAALVSAHKAHAADERRLVHDRQEGRSLVSYGTMGGWVTITKAALTEVLGVGRDVKIELPRAAARVLKLMCPALVVLSANEPEGVSGA
jgi:hypothetical protein